MRTLVLTAAASALFASAMTLAITQSALVAKWGPQIASGAEHIHPESLSRLPPVDRETFDADGQRIYDLIAKAYGGRKLSGPAAASLYSPSVAEPVHMLNEYLRKQGVLGPRFTELAILVTARELDQQYEWSAHALAGARVGLEQPIIDLVRYKKPPVGLAEKDTLIIRFAQQLLREIKTQSRPVCRFGPPVWRERNDRAGNIDRRLCAGRLFAGSRRPAAAA